MEKITATQLSSLLPPQDRRRRKRILTLRNARLFAIAVAGLFVLVSLYFEFWPKHPGEFGRLYARRTREVAIEGRRAYTVVEETNIADQVGADPLLLEAARRQQYLGVTPADIAAMREAAQPAARSLEVIPGGAAVLGQATDQQKARIEITGGPEGVYVKRE